MSFNFKKSFCVLSFFVVSLFFLQGPHSLFACAKKIAAVGSSLGIASFKLEAARGLIRQSGDVEPEVLAQNFSKHDIFSRAALAFLASQILEGNRELYREILETDPEVRDRFSSLEAAIEGLKNSQGTEGKTRQELKDWSSRLEGIRGKTDEHAFRADPRLNRLSDMIALLDLLGDWSVSAALQFRYQALGKILRIHSNLQAIKNFGFECQAASHQGKICPALGKGFPCQANNCGKENRPPLVPLTRGGVPIVKLRPSVRCADWTCKFNSSLKQVYADLDQLLVKWNQRLSGA